MNLIPFLVSWAALATVVLGLAIYRKVLAAKEVDYLHLEEGPNQDQVVLNRKLESIDKWGKTLTVVVAIYAMVLLGAFLYSGWMQSSQVSQ